MFVYGTSLPRAGLTLLAPRRMVGASASCSQWEKEKRMADDDLKELNVRLERLEAKLDTVAAASSRTEISEKDVAAFHRVQNAFWEDGSCGINETSPCIVKCAIFKNKRLIPIPRVFDRECICGPCNIGSQIGQFGGLQRFGGLGGG